ncbi:hypothetical protein B0T18DRAFT_447782 [Schizothecium vesticola]|uniref:Cyclin-D1-binding protein 1-like N-terminal domain-containing protein n=1 Tax=Schizothecium vesticola TaxID=314040 RepID=A0AA40EP63_9PEZI|nr:hypothetical protein B0T18DRAFT_447782 [Schizothecium vesticola]
MSSRLPAGGSFRDLAGPATAAALERDVLSLAHDAAILIRAHSTKISLLIINDPFTPTAIAKVIKELLAGPLPALATSAQLCAPARYTRTLQADLAWKNGRVLKELKALLSQIPKDGKILSGDKKTAAPGKGSIATTAVLWSACDDVVAFAKRGFAGNLVHKVEEGRDTVRDMMEELKEWGEEVDEEDDDENDDDEEVSAITNGVDNTHLDSTQSAQDLVDEWMSSERHIPRDDPDKIRERLEVCLRRIRLTTLLYQAAVKRRLKTLPKLPPAPETKIAARVDEVMERLKKLPDGLGNLAMAFYQLDPAEVDRLMEQCFGEAVEVSEILAKGWEGQEDEFTEWAGKFRVGIKK